MTDALTRRALENAARPAHVITQSDAALMVLGSACPLEKAGPAPEAHFQILAGTYFKGGIKPPFNEAARDKAGFPVFYYNPLISMTRP